MEFGGESRGEKKSETESGWERGGVGGRGEGVYESDIIESIGKVHEGTGRQRENETASERARCEEGEEKAENT